MAYEYPPRKAPRRIWSIVVAITAVVVSGALLGFVMSPVDFLQGNPLPAAVGPVSGQPTTDEPGPRGDRERGAPSMPLGEADGMVPEGVTVFDDEYPAVANLDPALLDALRAAASDAGDHGVRFVVNSGWRSPAYQEQLLREAVAQYGSAEEAARWVATPETSLHVSGDAVDLGPPESAGWLGEHGAEYGLCQIYDNEPWHFELVPDAVGHRCPARYADPTQDPRLQP